MKKINPNLILALLIFLSLTPFFMEMFIYEGVFVRYLRLQSNFIFLLFLALGLIWIAANKPDVDRRGNTRF